MNRNQSIKVIIATPSLISRRGLRSIVSENRSFAIAGEAQSAAELERVLQSVEADVLITDLNPDEQFTTELIAEIKKQYPRLNILVLSEERPVSEIKKVLNLGVRNYLLNDCSEKEIVDAITASAGGQKYFSRQIIDALLDRELTAGEESVGGLSGRELEVVKYLTGGLKPKEIAARMKLSYHTIIAHKRNIYTKLGISSAIELAQFAMRNGLINP